MALLNHPRHWTVAAAAAMLAVAAWLLLAPLTAIYVSDVADPAPHELTSRYSWWTTEQNLLYSDAGPTTRVHQINGVRLNCGNAFTTGPHIAAHTPDGPKACAELKTPRTIVALVLIALTAAAPLALRALPAAGHTPDRYTQSAAQRRALRKSRR